MFRALDRLADAPIVSLDFADAGRWPALRVRGREHEFGCPHCKSDVIFRAGPRRRPHFAHRCKSDCPLAKQSAGLLALRGALYDWLRSKFGDAVAVEHPIADVGLPRPVDCWVARDHGPPLAYWIFERGKRPAVRDALAALLKDGRVAWTVLFSCGMLRADDDAPDRVRLGPTERAFVRPSSYECAYRGGASVARGRAALAGATGVAGAGTLHYLDAASHRLVTLRALTAGPCASRRGVRVESALRDVLVHPGTGELVHPGEHERLVAWSERQEAEEKRVAEEKRREEEQRVAAEALRALQDERRRRLARARAQRKAADVALDPMVVGCGHADAGPAEPPPHLPTVVSTPEHARAARMPRQRPDVPCERCSRPTPHIDQTIYYGRSGTCVCRACVSRGA